MKTALSVLAVLLTLSANTVHAADALAPAGSLKTDANEIDVSVSEYMFSPVTLNITAGTKVTWVNHDEVPHTIVDSAVPKLFHSSALDTNDRYSFVFAKPGTYNYFCTLHPQMVGTIIVAEAK